MKNPTAGYSDPKRPPCFGVLDIVFPRAPDGLRHTPQECFQCEHKTQCLRLAMERPEGAAVREEALDRAYNAGVVGFFERWSKKKSLHTMRSMKDKSNRTPPDEDK